MSLEGISTGTLAQLSRRFSRWVEKKLPLGADVRAIQVAHPLFLYITSMYVWKAVNVFIGDCGVRG